MNCILFEKDKKLADCNNVCEKVLIFAHFQLSLHLNIRILIG
jgi:hypothetical protein